jgi:hypothetical protein
LLHYSVELWSVSPDSDNAQETPSTITGLAKPHAARTGLISR